MITAQLIEKLGVPVGTLLIVMAWFSWIMRITIKHFITTIKEQTEERKCSNEAFLNSVSGFSSSMTDTAVSIRGLDDRVGEVYDKADLILRVVNGK